MHQIYKTQAFIFKKEDRMEADRIFSVFAQTMGRVEIFAKAIRRIASKLKGGMDIFYLSDIEFVQGKKQKTLTDATVIKKFKNIAQSPEKLEVANNVSIVLDQFINGQEPDEKIWNLIVDFFEKLNDCQLPAANYTLLYYYFFWNFISVLGYSPQLFKCVRCHQKLHPDNLYFSNKEGGIICAGCFQADNNSQKINSDIVKIIRLFLENDWQTILKLKLPTPSLDLLKIISEDYYKYILPDIKIN